MSKTGPTCKQWCNKFQECGCSDGHQITMLLHCMTPLGAVGFQKLLKVLEDNNSVDSNFMEKLKGSNDLIEGKVCDK